MIPHTAFLPGNHIQQFPYHHDQQADRGNQAQIAEGIQTTKSYVNRMIKKPNGVVNNTFVQMMEALGYDIELTYVKRNDK